MERKHQTEIATKEDKISDLVDLIITKSVSRFARNTTDCLNYVRKLKNIGVGILFEKENIQNG